MHRLSTSSCRHLLAVALALAALLLPATVAARSSGRGHAAPPSQAFLDYQAILSARLHSGLGAPVSGIRPAPIDLPIVTKAHVPALVGALPSSYDLRPLGRVTSVKDQGQNGTCWVFASMGSLESCLLPGESWDFSEDNCALTSGFDRPYGAYETGGNYWMSTAYLARWSGPMTEAEDAYGDGSTPPGLAAGKHVQEVLWLPARGGALDNDGVKTMLSEHGAVYASMHVGISDQTKYFDPVHSSWYYNGGGSVDHAVLIVGWDDAYPRANFAYTPPGDGAFIVKNSWGTGWGDDGYFYVSYYDSQFGGDLACFVLAEGTDNYGSVYQYDPLGAVTGYGWGDGDDWCANTFTAQASEPLEAVGFYTMAPDTQYQVYVGPTPQSRTLQTSGTFATMGYHTVTLPSSVQLTEGQAFTVTVRLYGTDYSWPLTIEAAYADYSSGALSDPGQSYVSNTGVTWYDLANDGNVSEANACIKAFTAAPDAEPPMTTPSGNDDLWHRAPVTVTLTGADAGSGVAYTEYSRDGGLTWVRGTSVVYRIWKRGGGSGEHTLLFQSKDNAGNLEDTKSIVVKIDARPPHTVDDAPDGVRMADTTVHLSATDSHSGVKQTWYSFDGESWTEGSTVTITAAGHAGVNWICYYSTDNAGNVESRRWCSVTIAGA